ncbi:HlyD family secretion protein [Geothrix fermentans]|uniref:HlyD family secretion protein n=1 Tax=Geothrix fermentans TaxID=44676 RepID=UPI000426C498|nr:HlyD family secretion protein [Geothrix fermentans]
MDAKTKKWASLAVILALAVTGTVWALVQWRHGQIHVSTDNAYVKGHVMTVSSHVPGPLLQVAVQENQAVRAGQVLASLDPRDYDAAIARAEASLAEARSALALNEAQIAQARAQVQAAESQQALAGLEKRRMDALLARQSIPRQKHDQVTTAEAVAGAQVAAARKQVAAAQGLLGVSRSKVQVAQAALDQTRLQRSYCAIVAPCDGTVSRKLAEPGMVVAAGQPLLAVVPLGQEDLWVEANFKETQLRRVRPGQRVRMKTDLDSRTFMGTVESLSAGTGAAFSLLPAENATGNWVKVVQRLPVKITLDPDADPERRLRLGLSVEAEIDTRSR